MKQYIFFISAILMTCHSYGDRSERYSIPQLEDPGSFAQSTVATAGGLSDMPAGSQVKIIADIEFISTSAVFGEVKSQARKTFVVKSIADFEQQVADWQKANGKFVGVSGYGITTTDADGRRIRRAPEHFAGTIGADEVDRRMSHNIKFGSAHAYSAYLAAEVDRRYIEANRAPDPLKVMKMRQFLGEFRNIRLGALGALAPTAAAAFAGLALTAPDQSMAAAAELTEDETVPVYGVGQ